LRLLAAAFAPASGAAATSFGSLATSFVLL
jgi:hypothetical protein